MLKRPLPYALSKLIIGEKDTSAGGVGISSVLTIVKLVFAAADFLDGVAGFSTRPALMPGFGISGCEVARSENAPFKPSFLGVLGFLGVAGAEAEVGTEGACPPLICHSSRTCLEACLILRKLHSMELAVVP